MRYKLCGFRHVKGSKDGHDYDYYKISILEECNPNYGKGYIAKEKNISSTCFSDFISSVNNQWRMYMDVEVFYNERGNVTKIVEVKDNE